MKADHLKAESK